MHKTTMNFTRFLFTKSLRNAKFGSVLLNTKSLHKPNALNLFGGSMRSKRIMSTAPTRENEKEQEASPGEILANRFMTTAEVTVSKLLPGGFGWQYFSILAENMGLQATDIGFFAMTGLGDGCFVFMGHTLYYAAKSMVASDVNVKKEAQTGFFLGSAAVCSGFVWQPTVNYLQALELPFDGVALGTTALCGAAFFGGLRLFRTLYSPVLPAVEANTAGNIKSDALLSASIGGATGAFVGTDVSYLNGEGNFLRPLVGVEEADSALAGCVKAGSSTALGFAVAQSAQNVAVPTTTKNWTD